MWVPPFPGTHFTAPAQVPSIDLESFPGTITVSVEGGFEGEQRGRDADRLGLEHWDILAGPAEDRKQPEKR